jgi:hypothetical protein
MIPKSGTYTAVSTAQGQSANSNTAQPPGAPLISEATLKDAGGALWRATFDQQQLTNAPVAPGRVFTWDGIADVPALQTFERVPVAQP